MDCYRMRANFIYGSWEFLLSETPPITYITFESSSIFTIPDNFVYSPNVRTLDLSRNFLHDVPVTICNLINLQSLQLWVNPLTRLPIELAALTSLQDLNVSSTHLPVYPRELCLPSLRTLILGDNTLTTLPDEISNMTSLTELNVGLNSLTHVPATIANMPSLRLLHLFSNHLSALPLLPSSLVELDLWSNQIHTPDILHGCTALTTLNLGKNGLTGTPNFTQFTCLHTLKITFNTMATFPILPPSIEEVDIGFNTPVLTVPEDIGHHCPNLKKIILPTQGLAAPTGFTETRNWFIRKL
ncbi:Leucine rich repeat protein [Pelomyxa schiedti]|nr:Leucine rich repeat protein [Pelomyxa schiedti]